MERIDQVGGRYEWGMEAEAGSRTDHEVKVQTELDPTIYTIEPLL